MERVLSVIISFWLLLPEGVQGVTSLSLAFTKNSRPTKFWIRAVSQRNTPEELVRISKFSRPFEMTEKLWLAQLSKLVPVWETQRQKVEKAFPSIEIPKKVEIVVGNQGGDDAFSIEDHFIGVDLSKWVANFGPPKDETDSNRMIRILNHEYAHLLTKAWLQKHPQDLSTPYSRALFEMFYEGIGNYFSLSDNWVSSEGEFTDRASKTLEVLVPILKERLEKLKVDEGINEKNLIQGLSNGSFERKWGALPVALWLSNITGGSSELLGKEIGKGIYGIEKLILQHINKVLPEHPSISPAESYLEKFVSRVTGEMDSRRYGSWIYLPASLFALLFFLLCLGPSRLIPSIGRRIIRRPDLLPFSYRLHAIKTPTDANAWLWVTLILFVLWFGSYVFGFFSDTYKDTNSDFVAIQASTLALLFPLVILILDKKEESFLNIISAKEVLLHYAWAFPASLALPLFSTYYMFDGHKLWALAITTSSVLIALFVLYRLLKITFSLKTWKNEESELLSRKIRLITAEDLSDRIASGALPNQLKDLAPHIQYSSYFYEGLLQDKRSFKIIRITAHTTGGIVSIRLAFLETIFKLLKLYSKQPNEEVVSRLVLTEAPGSDVEKDKTTLAVLAIRKDEYSDQLEHKVRRYFRKAIKISSHESANLVPFETLFSRLGQAGRDAIEKNNQEVIESLRETYVFFYNEIQDTLKANASHLSVSGDPRTVLSFGRPTNPFELIEKRLRKITRDSFTVPGVEDQVLHNVSYFPYALCVQAIRQSDFAAYNRFISIASLQGYLAKAEKKESKAWMHTIDWLEGILKYNFKIEIDEHLEIENSKPIKYEILIPAVREFQNYIHHAIDAKQGDIAKEAFEILEEELTIFKHEDIESEIELQQSYMRISNLAQESEIKERLAFLKVKKFIKDELFHYTLVSLVALCAYIIYHLESKDSEIQTNDVRDDLFMHFLSFFPTSLDSLLKFYLFFERKIKTREWQWDHWEEHPMGQIIHYSTDQNIDRIFAVLFARTAENIDRDFSASNYSLRAHDVFALQPNGRIRKSLEEKSGNTEQRLKLFADFDDKKKENLFLAFDAVFKEAKLQDDVKLAEKPLAEPKLLQFKKQFCEGFKKRSLFRNKIPFVFPDTTNSYENRFGIKIFEDREAFVEGGERDFGNFGDHFGQEAASGEDEIIFEKMESISSTANQTTSISNALKFVKDKKIPLNDLLIVGDYRLLEKEFKEIPEFVQKFKARASIAKDWHAMGVLVIDGFEIPVYKIHPRNKKLRNHAFLFSAKNITVIIERKPDTIECLMELGWQVMITDPSQDPELKKDLIAKDYDFLQGYDLKTRERIIGTRILLDIFANISLSSTKPDEIVLVIGQSDNNAD